MCDRVQSYTMVIQYRLSPIPQANMLHVEVGIVWYISIACQLETITAGSI